MRDVKWWPGRIRAVADEQLVILRCDAYAELVLPLHAEVEPARGQCRWNLKVSGRTRRLKADERLPRRESSMQHVTGCVAVCDRRRPRKPRSACSHASI